MFSDYQLNYQEVIEDLQSAINLELGDKESFWNRPGHPMTWERYHSTEGKYDFFFFFNFSLLLVRVVVQEVSRIIISVISITSGGVISISVMCDSITFQIELRIYIKK